MTNLIPSARARWLPVPAVAIITAAGLLAGCSATDKKLVCRGEPQHIVVVASTSVSDLALSQQFAPAVSEQAIKRAATSCGDVSLGLLGGRHAEADLVLQRHEFRPSRTSVYGSITPILEPLEAEGNRFAARELLQPLKRATAVGGSPFLNGLARVAAELKVHAVTKATIVLVGDGVAVERGVDGQPISFGAASIDVKDVNAFAPLYASLQGSCVILAGSGAEADLTDEQLRTARQLLGGVLQKAGAKFLATRGDDIPWSC